MLLLGLCLPALLVACDRTPVVVPAPTVVAVPGPPGPAGSAGDTGAPGTTGSVGDKGDTGSKGDTAVIVVQPPASAPAN